VNGKAPGTVPHAQNPTQRFLVVIGKWSFHGYGGLNGSIQYTRNALLAVSGGRAEHEHVITDALGV